MSGLVCTVLLQKTLNMNFKYILFNKLKPIPVGKSMVHSLGPLYYIHTYTHVCICVCVCMYVCRGKHIAHSGNVDPPSTQNGF